MKTGNQIFDKTMQFQADIFLALPSPTPYQKFDSIKKGRIQVFDPTSTYEKHALWGANT
jgi:hypothetical protein